MKKLVPRLLCFTFLFTFAAFNIVLPAASALSADQKEVYQRKAYYFDLATCSSPAPPKETSSPEPRTTKDKIGQLMFVGATNNKQEMVDVIKKYKIGGVMLTAESTSLYSKAAISELKEAAGGSLLVASDEEGGSVQRLKAQTGSFPSAKELGSKSVDHIEKTAESYGEKLADLGVNINYAPVLDIDDGNNSVISGNGRAFSGNAETITEKAGAFAKGMRAAGVTPVFKHFPGHGRADGDSHTEAVTTPHLSSLQNKDLVPYEDLLKDSDSGVMMGHLIVPGLTDGKQATLSSKATELLRDNPYNFKGVIFSDEIANMKAIADKYNPDQAVSLAIQAGIDMPLFNKSPKYSSIDEQISKTIDRVEAEVSSERIEESYKRIASLKKEEPKPAANSEACVCTVGGISTDGENNKVAFEFLVSKVGMTAEQAAGAVGSMIAESGGYDNGQISPTVIYGGEHSNTPPPGDTAWGIAQFFGGRKRALVSFAESKGMKAHELITQLEYIKFELEGAERNAFNKLKATSTPKDAATSWTVDYERPSPDEVANSIAARIRNADEVFRLYGNGAPTPATPSDSASTSTTGEGCAESGDAEGTGESKGDFIWPVPESFPLTSCWGTFRPYYNGGAGGGHSGLDIGTPVGTPIKASDGGTVELSKKQAGGFGNVIVIKHSGGKWTLYAHQSELLASQGKKVDQGQLIGKTGNTGSSSGPHLHFNLQTKGGEVGTAESGTVNPLDYLPKDGRPMGGCKAGQKGGGD